MTDPLTSRTLKLEPLIGAHESIAGGIHLAFNRAESVGCKALQVFTKNASQWRSKPLTDEDIASYKTAASKSSIHPVIAHDSYLINLCATNADILKKSLEAFVDELRRDRKSTRLNSSHIQKSRMPSSA